MTNAASGNCSPPRWISSLNGISKIEISSGSSNPVIINYDVKDGLQGYEFFGWTSLKDSDGRLYFSGRDGFNRFLPGQSNNTLPFVALNNVMISNKSISEVDDYLTNNHINEISALDLPYDKNDLSFEFASIHYSRPDKNRVLYKMEGVDTENTSEIAILNADYNGDSILDTAVFDKKFL